MSDAPDAGCVLDRLFDALAVGDVDAACACLTADARVWHGFDRVALDRDTIARDWTTLMETFPERRITEVRRAATPTGFVQQHLQVLRTPAGDRRAWPVCVVVTMRDGLIARIDEYIDRAGHFSIDDEPLTTTPGAAHPEVPR